MDKAVLPKVLFTAITMMTSLSGIAIAEPITSNEALTTGAEYFVRPQLRDPASGIFSGLHGVTTDRGDYLCGYVNAKNGLGGYTGPQRFVVIVPSPFVGQVFFESQTPNKKFKKSWIACNNS